MRNQHKAREGRHRTGRNSTMVSARRSRHTCSTACLDDSSLAQISPRTNKNTRIVWDPEMQRPAKGSICLLVDVCSAYQATALRQLYEARRISLRPLFKLSPSVRIYSKSQLAIEYCNRLRQRSPHTWIYWILASNADRTEQEYICDP